MPFSSGFVAQHDWLGLDAATRWLAEWLAVTLGRRRGRRSLFVPNYRPCSVLVGRGTSARVSASISISGCAGLMLYLAAVLAPAPLGERGRRLRRAARGN